MASVSDRLTSPTLSSPCTCHRSSLPYLQSPGSTQMHPPHTARQFSSPPRLRFSMPTNNNVLDSACVTPNSKKLVCRRMRMATRSKGNRTYRYRLFDAVDVKIDHEPTLQLVWLLLHNPTAQHGEFRVWVAKQGNFFLRVVFSCGLEVPIKDLAVELFG